MGWTFTFATELNPVVIYSAVVSTAVACWQVYTYARQGPRLHLSAGGNRRLAGQGQLDAKTYFVVNAVNVGTADTTIQVIGLYIFDNWWKRFRRKSSKAFVINTAPPGSTCPHILKPGHTFMGLGVQSDELVTMSRHRLLYITVAHSMAKRDVLVRLKPIEDVKEWNED